MSTLTGVQGVPRLSPTDSWDWLHAPMTLTKKSTRDRWEVEFLLVFNPNPTEHYMGSPNQVCPALVIAGGSPHRDDRLNRKKISVLLGLFTGTVSIH